MTLTGPPPTTYEILRGRVQERIAGLQLDTDREPDRIRQLVATVVDGYQREANSGVGGRPLSNTDQFSAAAATRLRPTQPNSACRPR